MYAFVGFPFVALPFVRKQKFLATDFIKVNPVEALFFWKMCTRIVIFYAAERRSISERKIQIMTNFNDNF
jgi:hypothetical protein